MHAWEGRPFDDIATLCVRRDPHRYPIGCATALPGPASREVVQWFRNTGEMAAFLWRMEPQRWGLRMAALIEFKTQVEPVVVQLDVEGPQPALVDAYNAISRPHFEVRWWGSFEDLRAGREPWPASVLAAAGHADAIAALLRERSLIEIRGGRE